MSATSFVAMVATHKREELLLRRALPSILSQSCLPDEIIIIDDGAPENPVDRSHLSRAGAKYLVNRRTRGLSGALNTGLDHLVRTCTRPDQVYVAFLDDDDAWTDDHLSAIKARVQHGAEAVAVPFFRIETGDEVHRVDPPAAISADIFMKGNPGIQGSTFAARLDILLEAGGFNEALPSTTDRDLWIRLCRRGTLAYATTLQPSVYHYACPDRLRLSSPGSQAKCAGLEIFDRIHGPLMENGIRQRHLERAERLFGWLPKESAPDSPRNTPAPLREPHSGAVPDDKAPPLLIGIIADERRIPSVSRLLNDIARVAVSEDLLPPDVLLLENRLGTNSGKAFGKMVKSAGAHLRIHVIDHATRCHLAETGEWHPRGNNCGDGRLSISDARSLLQSCLHEMARKRPGCVVWVLDDDMRLNSIIASPEGLRRQGLRLRWALAQMKASGGDICIGSYTGSPPLPAVASVRGQLLDLLWNLRRLSVLPADALVPAAENHNEFLRQGRRDYYYDLSRSETDRLETPFSLEPAHHGERCKEALVRLGKMIPRILAGEAPFRPLVATRAELDSFTSSNALFRGGNTFVFDPSALADMPNLSPVIEGRPARRSDMIWALIQKQRLGRKVVSVPVPVYHDRSDLSAPDILDHAGIADDICGFAVFSALKEAEGNMEHVETLCFKYLQERLAALRLSFYRIRGLARELINWCAKEAPEHVPRASLDAEARQLLGMFSSEAFATVEKAVTRFSRPVLRGFLKELDEEVEGRGKALYDEREMNRTLANARAKAACRVISPYADSRGALRVLGQGGEGVSVTDGQTVWKLFDRWTSEQESRAVPVLKYLSRARLQEDILLRPLWFKRTPAGWILALPFEPSQPWKGGNGKGLVALLAGLLGAGLVCRNLHPKNLRVADGKVRLIDYGADVLRAADVDTENQEFQKMCRRAWLCWRWWWREDLDVLMRRSLHEPDLPELAGHKNLIRAVREWLDPDVQPDPLVVQALTLKPERVFDLGAGKGHQAAELAKSGVNVTVWDPDPSVAPRLDALAPLGVVRVSTRKEAVDRGPYDLVICRRVACLLDEVGFDELLSTLRASLAHEGRALLALCHPAYVHRVRLAEAEPHSAPCPNHAGSHWTKRVRATGRILDEFHRNERLLRRRLGRAGLRVVNRLERQRIELDRFETVANMLTFELVAAPQPSVSLLIKACAMDAEVVQQQVRDILFALEGPGTFRETIIALDTRTKGFPRPHTSGNMEALRAAAEQLLAAGDIDRIIETPASEEVLRALNHRWFGLDLPASHSVNGSATGALLAGFEACAAPRVLHVDLDMMIGRKDRAADPIAELNEALDACPEALTASCPVAHATPRPWTAMGDDGHWRVESRIALVDMPRMRNILPLPNEAVEGAPRYSWHRAMDAAVKRGRGHSLRGGDGRVFCVHPPNIRKRTKGAWEEVRTSIARGFVSPVQHTRIEWAGSMQDWRYPERQERFVFVINGHNVMPERFRRCWETVVMQRRDDWGAIVIDDASEHWIADEISHILAQHAQRVSFLSRRHRVRYLGNLVHAVRHLCTSPEQIIITLDADDHLIGENVLDRLASAYDAGADLTVGSMLRTDKEANYQVCFDDPAQNHGGNVWQHLRSFKKGLFDAIPDATLRLDGEYVELASDWAYMIPMVQAAENPVWIRYTLYLHEPGEKRTPEYRRAREFVISRLMRQAIGREEAAE